MSHVSKFASLYKNADKQNELQRQEIRRKTLLEEHKRSRAENHDDRRKIEEFLKIVRKKRTNRHPHRSKHVNENPLQLSEWMKVRPDDIEQWLLVPCPKGRRCLLIASNGKTKLYSQYGFFIKSFHTDLLGDSRSRMQITILDCIVVQKLRKIFVLDVMAYGGQDVANCDTQFRFYWLRTKLLELEQSSDCEYEFMAVPSFDMANDGLVAECLQRFPQYEENVPELDGFLFYHKDASYTYGTTPLVLWLFAFMVPEVLHLSVNPTYMMSRPSDYIDYLHYIVQFDEAKLKKNATLKQRREKRQQTSEMDQDANDGCEIEEDRMDDTSNCDVTDDSVELEAIIDHERNLELE